MIFLVVCVLLSVASSCGANSANTCEIFSPPDAIYLRRKEITTSPVPAANLSDGFTILADVTTRSVNASMIKMPHHALELASLYREGAFRLDLQLQHPRRVVTASLRIFLDPTNTSNVESYTCDSSLRLLANRRYHVALQFFHRHESALLLFVDHVLQAKCIVSAQDTSLKYLTPPYSSYETPTNTFSISTASPSIYSGSTVSAVYYPRQISYADFLSTSNFASCSAVDATVTTSIIVYPYFYIYPDQFTVSMRLAHLLASLANIYATTTNVEVLLTLQASDLHFSSQIPYPVTIINTTSNYADAINAAAAAASSHNLVLLSTGIYLEMGWLTKLDNSGFDIAGARIYDISDKIFHSGYEFLEYPFAGATTYMLLPHHQYRGYWRDDKRAQRNQPVVATSDYITMISSKLFAKLGGLNSSMAPLFALPDLCLRATSGGYSVGITDASAVLLDEYNFVSNPLIDELTINYFMPLYLFGEHAAAMTAFSDTWLSTYRETRRAHYLSVAQSFAANITSPPQFTWVIHCGGSQGYEAATILQELHPLIDVRTIVRRHGSCEHSDTLSGMPVYFRDILEYTTQKTFVAPYIEGGTTNDDYDNSIVLYARDYREIGAWVPSDAAYIIGRYMYETDALPYPWVRHCNFLDEVWVPSRWQAETFKSSGVLADKLHIMPETVDANFFTTNRVDPLALPGTPLDHPARNATTRPFTYCSVFKMEERKGWKEMVEAFVSEFTASDNAILLLRTYIHTGSGIDEENFNADTIRKAIKDHLTSMNLSADALTNRKPPRIEVVSEHLPSWQLVAFYKSCDAFVLSTHGEGWGLPTHEAMVLGLPVITTNWGGSTEFVTEESGLLINTTGLISTGDADPWLRGYKWADIDVSHMQQLMRQIYANRTLAQEIGQRGQKFVMDHFSAKSVASTYARRISEIHANLNLSQPPHGEYVMSHFDSNFGMTQQYKTCAVSAPRIVKNITRSGVCKVAIITTWEPSKALRRSLLSVCPEGSQVDIIAVRHNDEDPGVYNTSEVKFTFRHATTYDYIEAADFINRAGYEAVLVQFEFGMLYGDKLICMLRELKTDIYTTVHTVTRGMIDSYHNFEHQLVLLSHRIIVMTHNMRHILNTFHAIPTHKIIVIPHGVPKLPYNRLDGTEQQSIAPGKKVIMSNGLLHGYKGIEYVIRAMPLILEQVPDAVYLIHGRPHPNGVNTMEYYEMLLAEANATAPNNIIFNNSFARNEELYTLLQSATVYVNAYTDMDQSVSGTLAMALGTGTVAVSTPYAYAIEQMKSNAGMLIPFRDTPAIAKAIISILSNPERQRKMSENAYRLAQSITWDKVGHAYEKLIRGVL